MLVERDRTKQSELWRRVRLLLHWYQSSSVADTAELTGISHDQICVGLKEWFETNAECLGEPVSVEVTQGMIDEGADVVITGTQSRDRIGIQVKSDREFERVNNDETVSGALKKQFADALNLGLVGYAVMIFADEVVHAKKLHYWNAWAAKRQSTYFLALGPTRCHAIHRCLSEVIDADEFHLKHEAGWAAFFDEVGRSPTPYIGGPLDPDERFCSPRNWEELENSIDRKAITVVVGPPCAGKTFAVLQLLYQAWRSGRRVKWVGPYEPWSGIGFSPSTTVADVAQMTNDIASAAGPSGEPAIDVTDVIAACLRPGALVYVEDPFGVTEDDKEESLTGRCLFDMQTMVKALSGDTRPGCHLVITSRENLFTDYLADVGIDSLPDGVEVVRFGPNTYGYDGLREFAARILPGTQAVADEDIKTAADTAATSVDYPFEVEQAVRDAARQVLDMEAWEQTVRAVHERERSEFEQDLMPSSREEAALLLCLCIGGLQLHGKQRIEPLWTIISEALRFDDPNEAMTLALKRYAPQIHDSFCLIPLRNKHDISTLCYGFYHSIQLEAARRGLARISADSLSDIAVGIQQVGSSYERRAVGDELLRHWATLTPEGHDSLLNVLSEELPRCTTFPPLLYRALLTGDEEVLTVVEAAAGSFDSMQLQELGSLVASALVAIPDEWRWRLLSPVLDKAPLIGRFPWSPMMVWGNSLDYVVGQWDSAPVNIRDKVQARVRDDPSIFLNDFGAVIVENWEVVPSEWRELVLSPLPTTNYWAARHVLWTVCKCYQRLPEPLRDIVGRCLESTNQHVRGHAIMCVGVYHDEVPEELLDETRKALLGATPWAVKYVTYQIGSHVRLFSEELRNVADRSAIYATAMFTGVDVGQGTGEARQEIQELQYYALKRVAISGPVAALVLQRAPELAAELGIQASDVQPFVKLYEWIQQCGQDQLGASDAAWEHFDALAGPLRECAIVICASQLPWLGAEAEHELHRRCTSETDKHALHVGMAVGRERAKSPGRVEYGFPTFALALAEQPGVEVPPQAYVGYDQCLSEFEG